MFTIRIAGLLVEIDNRYEKIEEWCADYIVKSHQKVDIHVSISENRMNQLASLYKNNPELERYSLEEIEFRHLQYLIYEQLPLFDAVWLHACSVAVDNEGYALSAQSGYGKTTQARLWLEHFGARARIINGDNTIIRFMDGQYYTCGSPWGGTEGLQSNEHVPLKGICCLRHSDENHICRMDTPMAYSQMIRINQAHGLINDSNREILLQTWEQVVETVPVYWLYCNQSTEAARIAFTGYTRFSNTAVEGQNKDGTIYFDYTYMGDSDASVADRITVMEGKVATMYSNNTSMLIVFDMSSINTVEHEESCVTEAFAILQNYTEKDNCSYSTVASVVEELSKVNSIEADNQVEYEKQAAEIQTRIDELEDIISEIYDKLEYK